MNIGNYNAVATNAAMNLYVVCVSSLEALLYAATLPYEFHNDKQKINLRFSAQFTF